MALTITKSTDVILTTNLVVTIYGEPGIGKTSLAFSAERPLLLDFDQGAQRSIGRKDAVIIKNWTDIENININDLKGYNTIVIDTVGRLLEVLAESLKLKNPKMRSGTGELTLQGYGALNTVFRSWLNKIKSFGKDVVLIGHSKEEREKEQTFNRIDAMGSSKAEINKCSDLLGYAYANDNHRYIDFNPTSGHLGKNCAQIEIKKIPDYTENQAFLASLIQLTKTHMNAMSEEQTKEQNNYNTAIDKINECIEDEDFNGLFIPYILNNQALKTHLHNSATAHGLIFDKVTKQYMKGK